jgi:7-cyano-7-deazaguanine synthase
MQFLMNSYWFLSRGGVLESSIVLLSSGLDSTVNLYRALKDTKVVLAITFNYGQRAAFKEIQYSQAQCQKLDIPHRVIELNWFQYFSQSALTSQKQTVPVGSQVDIHSLEKSTQTAKNVWVPNRNGIFLNIAAAFAEGLKAKYVIPGFNLEEAATFPDNSQAYMSVLDQSFSYSTSNQVQVKCYTADLDKRAIVKLGRELGLDFSLVWTCYLGGEKPCGECESCQRFSRAMGDKNAN